MSPTIILHLSISPSIFINLCFMCFETLRKSIFVFTISASLLLFLKLRSVSLCCHFPSPEELLLACLLETSYHSFPSLSISLLLLHS